MQVYKCKFHLTHIDSYRPQTHKLYIIVSLYIRIDLVMSSEAHVDITNAEGTVDGQSECLSNFVCLDSSSPILQSRLEKVLKAWQGRYAKALKSLDLIERSADVKPERYQSNLSMVEITRTDTYGAIDCSLAFVHWIWFQSSQRKSESEADKLEGREVTVASDDKVREGVDRNEGNTCRKF